MPREYVDLPPEFKGVNLDTAPHAIADDELVQAVDVVFSEGGALRRRGPSRVVSALNFGQGRSLGVGQAYGASSSLLASIQLECSGGSLTSRFVRGGASAGTHVNSSITADIDDFVDIKPAIGGGMFIGIADGLFALSPKLFHWGGACLSNYTTGTVTLTKNSTTVTGSGTSWSDGSNVEAGSWLSVVPDGWTNAIYLQVESVGTTTSLTLKRPCPIAATAKAYTISSVAPFKLLRGYGRISSSTGAATVQGSGTKFQDEGYATGDIIVDADTGLTIGTVSSVQSQTALTLSANADRNIDNQAFKVFSDDTAAFSVMARDEAQGWITAAYAGRQWFIGNKGHRRFIHFSQVNDPFWGYQAGASSYAIGTVGDALEITETGRTGTSLFTAMYGLPSALLVFQRDRTTAVVGRSKETFETSKISDDGAICPTAVAPYQDGLIVAGDKGIYFFNGQTFSNLLEGRLARWWRRRAPATTKVHVTVCQDHVWIYVMDGGDSLRINKTVSTSTSSTYTLCINLTTGAASFHTNSYYQGVVDDRYLLASSSTAGRFFDVREILSPTLSSADELAHYCGATAASATVGPDMVVETKRYGSPLLNKWKRAEISYSAEGEALHLAVLPGIERIPNLFALTGTIPGAEGNVTTGWLSFASSGSAPTISTTTDSSYIEQGSYALNSTITNSTGSTVDYFMLYTNNTIPVIPGDILYYRAYYSAAISGGVILSHQFRNSTGSIGTQMGTLSAGTGQVVEGYFIVPGGQTDGAIAWVANVPNGGNATIRLDEVGVWRIPQGQLGTPVINEVLSKQLAVGDRDVIGFDMRSTHAGLLICQKNSSVGRVELAQMRLGLKPMRRTRY